MKKTIYTILIVLLLSILSSYAENETYTDLHLEANNWCPNIETTFKIYNATDFENKKYIEDNLCQSGEDPEDDNCEEFHIINSPEVKVYDGPFQSIDKNLLFEGKADSNGIFKVTFPRVDQYLIEITPTGDYNEYVERFYVEECKWATTTTNTTITNTLLTNQTFNYLNSQLTLIIQNTNLTSAEQITVQEKNNLEKPLIGAIKTIEIIIPQANYTTIETQYQLPIKENTTTKLYLYNLQTKTWLLQTFEQQTDYIKFNITSNQTIFGIIQEEIKPKITVIEQTQELHSSNQNITTSEDTYLEEDTTQDETNISATTTSQNNSTALFIAVIALLGILAIIFMKKKKPIQTTQQPNKEVLTTYEDTYKKAKEYVTTYKQQYSKDQLYRALKDSNVPEDIITKVFNEEYA